MRAAIATLALALCGAAAGTACGPKSHEPAGDGTGLGPGDDQVRKPGWDDALVTSMLGDLRKELGCPAPGASRHRHWCLATEGWSSGTPADLPETGLYVGLTLSLADGEPIADWLESGVTFSALGVRTSGGKVKARIAALVPSNQEEAELIKPAVAGVISVLQAEAGTVELPPDLASYVADLPAAADYALTRGAHGWSWTSSSATGLRRAGDYWIAVEIPPEGPPGILLSIFTDKIAP